MPNSDLLPSPLFELKENQLALNAVILELSHRFEQRGSALFGSTIFMAQITI